MISFIISAVVLTLLAVAIIVPTLLKKNYAFSDEYDDLNVDIAKDRLQELKQQLEIGEISQQTYQQLHDELQSTLALDLSSSPTDIKNDLAGGNKLTVIVLALFLPLMSVFVYHQLGDFNAATGKIVENTVIPAGKDRSQMTIEDAVVKLEQRLAEQPENADGWFMLAKTYMTMKQYQKAASSYEKVIEIVGDDADLLLRYADALAMSDGGKLTGKAKAIIDKVINLMPDNPTVLWMAGAAESQQGNAKKALSYWYKLQPMLSEEPEALQQLNQLVSKAETQLTDDEITNLKQVNGISLSRDSAPVISAGAEIMVTVGLDPTLKSTVKDNDIVFVFAKALQGPPMPLAAVKKTVADLPLTITLNDAMAMMPQMKLSNFEQVKISAVISRSGQPGIKTGDLFAVVSPVATKARSKINLFINQVK